MIEPEFRRIKIKTPGFQPTMTLKHWQSFGLDVHSVFAEPLFIDPQNGDFRVQEKSPARKLGFKNFPMDSFGVTTPSFKSEIETEKLKHPKYLLHIYKNLEK